MVRWEKPCANSNEPVASPFVRWKGLCLFGSLINLSPVHHPFSVPFVSFRSFRFFLENSSPSPSPSGSIQRDFSRSPNEFTFIPIILVFSAGQITTAMPAISLLLGCLSVSLIYVSIIPPQSISSSILFLSPSISPTLSLVICSPILLHILLLRYLL